jgi:hypothetical protein
VVKEIGNYRQCKAQTVWHVCSGWGGLAGDCFRAQA